MMTIISGTDRKNSVTRKIASIVAEKMNQHNISNQIVDLEKLPEGIFSPQHYGKPPEAFDPFQEKILNCSGILTLVPEYNGSFPGALKYFLDLCKFPESLNQIPSAFIGVSAGLFGSIRAIEQLEMVFQYRGAHIFGKRVLFPLVKSKLNDDMTEISDDFINSLLEEQIQEFSVFCHKLSN